MYKEREGCFCYLQKINQNNTIQSVNYENYGEPYILIINTTKYPFRRVFSSNIDNYYPSLLSQYKHCYNSKHHWTSNNEKQGSFLSVLLQQKKCKNYVINRIATIAFLI